MEQAILKTAIGNLEVCADKNSVTSLSFAQRTKKQKSFSKPSATLQKAMRSIQHYLEGDCSALEQIPIALNSTGFTKKVLMAMRKVKPGEVISYGELAARAGNPKAARAVGMICNKNPLPLIIPCHRVVGKDGSLTGYAGGLKQKEFLLRHEGVSIH